MATTSDLDNSDLDNPHQQEHGRHSTGEQRLSFGQSSLTDESGGRRSFSSNAPPLGIADVGAAGQAIGAYWEGRDLSRRANIHRSHLSSSIQTGIFLSHEHLDFVIELTG